MYIHIAGTSRRGTALSALNSRSTIGDGSPYINRGLDMSRPLLRSLFDYGGANEVSALESQYG